MGFLLVGGCACGTTPSVARGAGRPCPFFFLFLSLRFRTWSKRERLALRPRGSSRVSPRLLVSGRTTGLPATVRGRRPLSAAKSFSSFVLFGLHVCYVVQVSLCVRMRLGCSGCVCVCLFCVVVVACALHSEPSRGHLVGAAPTFACPVRTTRYCVVVWSRATFSDVGCLLTKENTSLLDSCAAHLALHCHEWGEASHQGRLMETATGLHPRHKTVA